MIFCQSIKNQPTLYANGKDVLERCGLNVTENHIQRNIKDNIALGLREFVPHQEQSVELMLLGGGPSLARFEDDIRLKRSQGVGLCTTNGAYNWCLERGLKPGAQIILDSREFNKRFVHPIVEGCKYLVASQCHPELVASLPYDETWLWHAWSEQVKDSLHECFPVYGGVTVMLQAIPLLIMGGFRKLHVYGMDSCLSGDEHHAYTQSENDQDLIVDIGVTGFGRRFKCHPWMVSQAQQFIEMQPMLSLCELTVYGDGLISHIIKTGAVMAQLEK